MAQVESLELTNASGMPVTYNRRKIEPGVSAMFVDETESVLDLQSKASLSLKETVTVRKVSGKVTLPVVDPVTGKVAYTCIGSFELVAPLHSTGDSRKDLRRRLKDFIGNENTAEKAFEVGEMPW